MFSEKLRKYAQEHIDRRLPMLGERGEEIEEKLKGCTPDEQVLMKFFYGTMPVRDVGEYDFEVFLGFVRHSLMVYETMEWCRELPEEIFLNYVLYYRINNENIEDCRRFFYSQLIDRIRTKTAKEAVLEINYWCAENASYETSDNRTISPLSMYRAGKGRCGEESTFAVTAFRSVGIPARQVYTPRWAHCDDNHAWVEVYVDGQWHFLGACEPEEVLDRGWFKNASSRTLMVHAREFSDYSGEDGERQSWREGCLCYRNVTSIYTETGELCVKVTEGDGTPAENARVFVEVLNSAEFAQIATLVTDAKGEASLCLGKGTVHLWAVKEGKIGETLIHTKDVSEVSLTLEEPQYGLADGESGRQGVGGWAMIDMKAPEEAPVCASHVTREQKEKTRQRVAASAKMRETRIAGFFQEELAQKYPKEQEILRLAAGNFGQVYAFLDRDANPDRKGMLYALSDKDYKDVTADLLERHLQEASLYRAEWEERGETDIYTRYILCPRIYFEELTCYRKELLDCLEERTKAGELEKFREEPERIWEYVREQIGYDEKYDYSALLSTPVTTLRLRFGSLMSRKILCTAICRALGVPARLNHATREVEVYRDGRFVKISGTEEGKTAESATLILKRREGEEWNYYQNWTIGRYREGRFETLDYQELQFDGTELRMELEPGVYRILTANRMPSGNQLAAECKFSLEPGQVHVQEMYLRAGDPEEMLVSNQLEDFDVVMDNAAWPASSIIGDGVHILMFLEPGEEPTEHVLNEMLTLKETLRHEDAGLCFVLRDGNTQRTAAWEKVAEAFPEGKVVYGAFDDIVEPLARRMYVDPEKLPLMILVNPGLQGIFACSGYRVGSVKLALDLLKVNREMNGRVMHGR